VAFTIGAADGWTFTCMIQVEGRSGTPVVADFALRGECPHGSELLVQNGDAIRASMCECAPSVNVLRLRDKLFVEWKARLGRPISDR